MVGLLPVSPKVGLGNCPMLNVCRFPTSQEDKQNKQINIKALSSE